MKLYPLTCWGIRKRVPFLREGVFTSLLYSIFKYKNNRNNN